MQLIEILNSKIKTNGPITFAEFMQEALYSPYGGYYTSSRTILGEKGDFITAPEITPLFGYVLANQCAEVLKHCNQPAILEFGAGTGQLCVDILTHLKIHNMLPETYYILEVSGFLKARQQQKIKAALPEFYNRIAWCETWPASFEGIMIANEVLDAMPVHRFLQTESDLLESYVDISPHNQFVEHYLPTQNTILKKHVAQVLPRAYAPYQSEANLLLPGWIEACAQSLIKGMLLIIDYGFSRHEYFHSDRNQGTLMCHYQHRTHSNPLIHIGEQDITAHVDFTHVAEAAANAGFNVAGFTQQAGFLIANGILNVLETAHTPMNTQAVKKLVDPSEMGELFKVLALTKQFDQPLSGFQLTDRRAQL